MNHLPQLFRHSKKTQEMDRKEKRRKPKLERRNALRNVDYEATPSSSSRSSFSSDYASSLVTRSLDLTDKTSFRVQGIDGEFDRICRSLGLSGPEDFAIPQAAWEARKQRSTSDLLPRSRLNRLDSLQQEDLKEKEEGGTVGDSVDTLMGGVRLNDDIESSKTQNAYAELFDGGGIAKVAGAGGGGGIKGVRPPVLTPPPSMMLPMIDDACSTWDLFKAFGPDGDGRSSLIVHGGFSSSEDEDEDEDKDEDEDVDGVTCKREEVNGVRFRKTTAISESKTSLKVHGGLSSSEDEDEDADGIICEREEVNGVRFRETAACSESCSFTTSNDDDSSSTTTEPKSTSISPNGRFKRNITSWDKGKLLGQGSFGSVYEGIAEDGFFFAVKEVSLIDQGSQAKQRVFHLEQEIALLSQFEHENIVQYYGTDKDKSKLYIFLELVTQGSLMRLYQTYHLRDSQVSAYTRQILCGLKYLHDRNVVHRDIKCANILVDANGSVKLADFGLAKATKLNDVKSCKGTAFWMAPEVVHHHNQGYGLPADIWSLGCTVLEMLTRRIPYSHLECMQALFRIGKGEPPPIPDNLSRDAQDFILRCLQANPNNRPAASELLDHPFVKQLLPTSSGSAASSYNFVRRV